MTSNASHRDGDDIFLSGMESSIRLGLIGPAARMFSSPLPVGDHRQERLATIRSALANAVRTEARHGVGALLDLGSSKVQRWVSAGRIPQSMITAAAEYRLYIAGPEGASALKDKPSAAASSIASTML
jgi:hypothetical protein